MQMTCNEFPAEMMITFQKENKAEQLRIIRIQRHAIEIGYFILKKKTNQD